jgi:small-conductance mechanosensitive channel
MRKPIVVWITQFTACLYGVTSSYGAFQNSRAFIAMLGANTIALPLLMRIGFFLLAVAVIIFMVIQAQRRSRAGRWLALLFVAHFLILAAVATPKLPPADLSSGHWWGSLIGAAIVFGVLLWWLYAIGFSRKARAWFTKTDHVPDPSAPR